MLGSLSLHPTYESMRFYYLTNRLLCERHAATRFASPIGEGEDAKDTKEEEKEDR
jgi:hypothetical protein